MRAAGAGSTLCLENSSDVLPPTGQGQGSAGPGWVVLVRCGLTTIDGMPAASSCSGPASEARKVLGPGVTGRKRGCHDRSPGMHRM